jgi:hypothetical protein
METITTEDKVHGYQVGDLLEVTRRDWNKWRRFWYFITLRKPPHRTDNYTITSVKENTFEIK